MGSTVAHRQSVYPSTIFSSRTRASSGSSPVVASRARGTRERRAPKASTHGRIEVITQVDEEIGTDRF